MKVTETIFNGKSTIIPMADVQNIEKQYKKIYENPTGLSGCSKCIGLDYSILEGISVITDKAKWNFEYDCWENAIYLSEHSGEATEFMKAWCRYRAEVDGMLVEEKQDGQI